MRIRAYRVKYQARPEALVLKRIHQARYGATPHAKEVKWRYERTAKRKIARDAYYQRNRERKLEMMRQYYLKNREKIWEKRKARRGKRTSVVAS